MILDPINSITSIDFYKKVAKQGIGRSLAYLAYLGLLFSIVATIALKVKVGPVVDETFLWLEKSMPAITFADGKLSTPTGEAVTIRHPSISDIAITVDTGRTEPVTAELLERNKVIAYVTSNAMYLMERPGQTRTFEFGKSAAAPGSKPTVIDAAFYHQAGIIMSRVLYPLSFVLSFFIFLLWKGIAAGFYSLMSLLINAITGAELEYLALLNITIYAQTLIIAVQAIFLFMPVGLPAGGLIAVAATGAYVWLAVKRSMEPAAAA